MENLAVCGERYLNTCDGKDKSWRDHAIRYFAWCYCSVVTRLLALDGEIIDQSINQSSLYFRLEARKWTKRIHRPIWTL